MRVIKTMLATLAIMAASELAMSQEGMIPATNEPPCTAEEAEPHYKLLQAWRKETIPEGYRVVVGGYEYFLLEKLPPGSKNVQYRYVWRDQMNAAEFVGELNLDGAQGYRYASRITIGVPEILERQEDSPGYEYRLVRKKSADLQAAAAEGFRFVGPHYQHTRSGAYWTNGLIVERPLGRPQISGARSRDQNVEYSVATTYRASTTLRKTEMLAREGYCAVHADQESTSFVFQKAKEPNSSCAYEPLASRQLAPRRNCPWYLTCPRENAQPYDEFLEKGLNELGARGFRLIGLRLTGTRPLLERNANDSRKYEYRVILLSGESNQSSLDQAFRCGFRAVALGGQGNSTHYAVMERTQAAGTAAR